jgi:hypothetical protein
MRSPDGELLAKSPSGNAETVTEKIDDPGDEAHFGNVFVFLPPLERKERDSEGFRDILLPKPQIKPLGLEVVAQAIDNRGI